MRDRLVSDRQTLSHDLEREIRARERALAVLNAVAAMVSTTSDVDEVLRRALVLALEVVGVEAGAISVLDETTNELAFRVQKGWRVHDFVSRGVRVPADRGLSGMVMETGQPVVTGDVSHDTRVAIPEFRDEGVKAMALAPMRARGRVLGVLGVMSYTPREFSPEEVTVVSAIADQIGTAFENARLFASEMRRSTQLTLINQVAQRAMATLNLNEILDTVAIGIQRSFAYYNVALFLIDEVDQGVALCSIAGEHETVVPRGYRQAIGEGIVGRVAETGQTLLVSDVSREPGYQPLASMDFGELSRAVKPVGSELGVPIVRGDEVIGVLDVQALEPGAFDQEDVRAMESLADHLAVAIDNARLYEETRRRLEELTVLHEVALAANSTLALEEVAGRVVTAVRQSLGFEHLCLLLVNEERGVLEFLGRDAEEPPSLEEAVGPVELGVGQGLAGWVAEHGTALRVGDVSQDPRHIDVYASTASGVRSALVVPLMVGDQVIGVVAAASSRPDAFSADDERLMTTVARQLAIAVDNARLYQETEWRLKEVAALYRLARQVSASLNIQEVLDSVVRSLRQAMGCRGCSIALLDTVDNVLEIRAAAGIKGKWQRDFGLRLGEGVAGRVALEGAPMYVPDVSELDGFIFFDSSVRSLLTVPLTIQQRVIGTLTVDSDQPHAFSEADERLLTIAAAQASIAIENARLYAGLKQRAENLAEAYAKLREADRLKDEIVQNVSHELRTPLTFVKGYVDLLLDGDAGPLTGSQKEYLGIVAEKTDVVARLVSDIMFMQQADRMPGREMPVSLTVLARRALRRFAVAAEQSRLTLVGTLPDDVPSVNGNTGRLLQVFDNLLDNAIKFSPEGGQVVVTVEDAGPMVRVSVSDQGIGIPKDEQEQIFERFYQVDSSAQRRFGGAGLGLAIARRIVEAHGGQIWVESEPGVGSTFYFAMPKQEA